MTKVQCNNSKFCKASFDCPHKEPHIRNEWCKTGYCNNINREVECVKISKKYFK